MRNSILYHGGAIAALAQLGLAAPAPQGIDLDSVATLPPVPSYTMAVGATAQVVSVANQASLIASVASAVSASALPTQASEQTTAVDKRAASSCVGGEVQPIGYGPLTTPDTAAAFLANPQYSYIASAAPVPTGYTQTFENLDGSSSDYAYLGYTTLKTYDTQECAAQCNEITDCWGINVYFERDPTVDPGTGTDCTNPPSTVNIKCVFWGSPISAATATNDGQWRDDFEVVIAGSNGYVNFNMPTPPGYTAPEYLGDYAINAPYDCNGDNTYMGYKLFQTSAFNIDLCSAACTAASEYDIATADGKTPMVCTFFNTYMLYENNSPQGQYCSLYNQTWNATWATNNGQWRGSNHYTISMSYISSNNTNPGVCVSDAATSSSSGNP